MRRATPIDLTPEEHRELSKLARGRCVEVRLQQRARMILLAAEGLQNAVIATKVRATRQTVGLWRKRYAKHRLKGIEKDAPRSGRIPSISPEKRRDVVRMTIEQKPEGQTHWSRSTMAKASGLSESTVGRIWKAHGLKPHLHKTFKVSNDPKFEEKLRDVVGLYLYPPEHALVFSCDEKSQIQALERTQRTLPFKPGRCGTMTHDYKRHGTTSLFAALNVADGTVINEFYGRHRHQEWIKFLNLIKKQTPGDREVHLICDNYATHKHEAVQRWQKRNPRFHFHFTPTSASWLNMVERFFRDLDQKALKRGSFVNVDDLTAAIQEYINAYNQDPTPFVWTASANDILEKVKRARATLDKL